MVIEHNTCNTTLGYVLELVHCLGLLLQYLGHGQEAQVLEVLVSILHK